MDGEFADAGEDAGEGVQHAPDVVGGIHVGGVEAGDHRVEAGAVGGRRERYAIAIEASVKE